MAENGAPTVVIDDSRALIRPADRQGDVISPHRAVLTLSKSMFNAGCFSLPFAWKLGGKWASFILTFVIAGFNWYGNHILVRSSQHLAKKSGVSSLDYGHFAKRVCDYSSLSLLRIYSKQIMYVVNVTILFYQLGMCSVSILFVSDNMADLTGQNNHIILMATIAMVAIMATNMFTEMKMISFFALVSSVFFLLGTAVIMQFVIQQPSQWNYLPGYTNFTGVVRFVGISMYAFEGQTMILPVENKLENPRDFLDNFGVLPTTMLLCTIFMTAIGFYGYNGFGQDIKSTMTINVNEATSVLPTKGFYSTVNVFLMIQSILGHSIAMYVVFDMFFPGFRRKFQARYPNVHKTVVDKGFRVFWVLVTYFMAISIPKLDIMIPLVGVTSGTLCALVYPPIFQTITFWEDWKINYSSNKRWAMIGLNFAIVLIGVFAIGAGVTANLMELF